MGQKDSAPWRSAVFVLKLQSRQIRRTGDKGREIVHDKDIVKILLHQLRRALCHIAQVDHHDLVVVVGQVRQHAVGVGVLEDQQAAGLAILVVEVVAALALDIAAIDS